jgi:uncharacterized protein
MKDVLREQEIQVMDAVLAEEEARRTHVVVYLSGAHAYGFPSPDSDLDLKAIHIARTQDLLGLDPPKPTFDRAEVIRGVEIDYTSNELAHALLGILEGNGNFIERVLGRLHVRSSPHLVGLKEVVQRSLSRRCYRHYRGFAHNQLEFLQKEPSVKKLLYVLRTTLTGIHLLETGVLETDLRNLMGPYQVLEAPNLIERKRAGERSPIDRSLLETWMPRVDALFARLERAREHSVLPEEPSNVAEVSAWLVNLRKTML